MFTRIFTDTLMIFLITYALVDIFCRFFNFVNRLTYKPESNKKLLILSSTDDDLENNIRAAAKKAISINTAPVIVLKKETHESTEIYNRLSNEFPYLQLLKLSDDIIFQIFQDAS